MMDYGIDKFDKKREMLIHRIDTNSLVDDIPYKFSYTFTDVTGRLSTLQIIDWEIYQLTRKLTRIYKTDLVSIVRVLNEKYFNEMTSKHDIYFFLGTNKFWHIRKSKNPYMIIGVFYPPKNIFI